MTPFNWDDLSKYAASKKLDYLVEPEMESFDVRAVEGYEGYTDEEILEMTKEETLWCCLSMLYLVAKETGVKTFKLSSIDQEQIDEIPYYINEMPNGDRYLTFD